MARTQKKLTQPNRGAVLLGLLLVGLLGVSCQGRSAAPVVPDAGALKTGCVQTYDPDRDYFPDKIRLNYATGFSVTYHNHYKVVTVTRPWKDADRDFQYVLVQCGTPPPPGFEAAQIIEIPVSRVVTLSTTHLPHFDRLGQVDALIGVDQFQRVNTPSVRRSIDEGKIQQFNGGNTLDLEGLVAAAPDLVMTFATGTPEADGYPRLMQAGIPVVLVAEYLEPSPLGQAEWLKFTALLFNQEAEAEAQFAAIATDYETMVALTQDLPDRPTVFTGSSYNGTWYVPGNQSYIAQLLRDAGADYRWADVDQAGSLPLDVEAVYDRAADADFWVNLDANWQTRADAIAADPRYGQFAAFQQNRVFNNNARTNGSGGNDYWESGVANPHWVLADLIAIFHPDLLPDHDLMYYQPLQP